MGIATMREIVQEQRQAELNAYIAEHTGELRHILRRYVLSMGIGSGDVETAADDLLHDMVIEALNHADRLPDADNPLPWLMGIALNLIKRRRAAFVRRQHREPLIRDLFQSDNLTEGELVDFFIQAAAPNDSQTTNVQSVEKILALLPENDAHILRLAIRHSFNGEKIAQALDISAGAARVRLHRAIKRARENFSTEVHQDE